MEDRVLNTLREKYPKLTFKVNHIKPNKFDVTVTYDNETEVILQVTDCMSDGSGYFDAAVIQFHIIPGPIVRPRYNTCFEKCYSFYSFKRDTIREDALILDLIQQMSLFDLLADYKAK